MDKINWTKDVYSYDIEIALFFEHLLKGVTEARLK
jgi:hypothetical protein